MNPLIQLYCSLKKTRISEPQVTRCLRVRRTGSIQDEGNSTWRMPNSHAVSAFREKKNGRQNRVRLRRQWLQYRYITVGDRYVSRYVCSLVRTAICFTICLFISPDLDGNTDPAKTKETSTKCRKWDGPEGPNSKACAGFQRRSRFRKWDPKPKTSFFCGEAARRPPAQRVGRLSLCTYFGSVNNLKNRAPLRH